MQGPEFMKVIHSCDAILSAHGSQDIKEVKKVYGDLPVWSRDYR
jgi:hypothetical protein